MDIATVLGFALACGAIVFSVVAGGGSAGAFIDYPSAACVFGGAVAAALMCFPLKNVLGMGGVMKNAVFNKPPNLVEIIETLVGLAETARRDGLLALESKVQDIKNPFIVVGLQMAVDGTRAEVIEEVMRTEMDCTAMRHSLGKSLLDMVGKYGPAFGMIGTLLGLVIMLGNMSDPNAIGPGMAVALLTTLYGAILANAVFGPFAEKLNYLNKQELLAMDIIVRGIMGIQSGDNPRVIQQKLLSFLPPKQRPKEAA